MAGNAIMGHLILISLMGILTAVSGQTNDTNLTTLGSTLNFENGTTAMMTTTEVTTPTMTPEIQPDIPTFEATEAGGEKVCMIIALDATISFEEIQSELPAGAEVTKSPSECPDTAKTSFIELGWEDDSRQFTLYMSFEVMEEGYTMVLINGSIITEDGNETVTSEWSEDGTLIPETPVGQSIHCRDVTMANIEFREYQLQPFAQNSGGGFGEVMECSDDSGMETFWIIIICVVAGVGGIALIGGIIYCMRRRKSTYESV